MRRNEIRHQILFLSEARVKFVELFLEREIKRKRRFVHRFENAVRNVFGRDLELPAYMVLYKFLEEGIVLIVHYVIVPYAASDEYFFNAF